MDQQWGRKNAAGEWLNTKPVGTLAAVLLAVVSGVAIGEYRHTNVWTPLQRFYLPAYVRSVLGHRLALQPRRYELLNVVDRKGVRLALDVDVRPVTTAAGDVSFALSEAAFGAGAIHLAWETGQYDHAKLQALLREWIYRDQGLADLARPALWSSLGVLVVGLAGRHPARHEPGPRAQARTTIERAGTGLGAGVQPSAPRRRHRLRAGVARRFRPDSPRVRVPRALESSHFLIMGDSGTGKSALIRQMLAAARGARRHRHRLRPGARIHAAVLHAGARRRDPQSARRAESVLDTGRRVAPRRRGAHARDVAVSRPAPRESVLHRSAAPHLRAPADAPADARGAGLVAVPRRRARPTGRRDVLRRDDRPPGAGPAQRRARLAQHGGGHAQAAAGGARHDAALERRGVGDASRHGWLFLTSTPETRPRLVPLTSLWLDTLVLRLMNQGQPRPRADLVRPGRAREPAATAAAPHGHHGEPEIEQSRGARLPGAQPARDAVRPRRGGDAVAAGDEDLPPHQRAARGEVDRGHDRRHRNRAVAGEPLERSDVGRHDELRAGAPGRAAGDAERDQRARAAARLLEGRQPRRPPELPVHPPAAGASGVHRTRRQRPRRTTPAAGHAVRVQHRTTDREHRLVLSHPSARARRRPSSSRRTPMLTISKPLSAGQARTYHAEEFRNARENYYTPGDEIRGQWHGQLATQWGLSGDVH